MNRPVQPAAPAAMPTPNQMPLPTGTVMKVEGSAAQDPNLTPMERQLLSQVGVNKGERPDLTGTAIGRKAEEIIARERTAFKSEPPPLPPDTPIPQPTSERDISDLSEAEQREVLHAISQYNNNITPEMSVHPALVGVDPAVLAVPGVADAMIAAHNNDTKAQPTPSGRFNVVDDMEAPVSPYSNTMPPIRPKVEPTPTSFEHQFSGSELLGEGPTTTEKEVSAIEPMEGTESPPCEWCGNSTKYHPPEISRNDKLMYQAMLLGPTRFKKVYTLFNDNLTVVFRTVTPWEADTILDQLNVDVATGAIIGTGGYAQQLTEYRMLVSIESVERKGGAVSEFPELGNLRFDAEAHRTALPELKAFMYNKVFISEEVKVALGGIWIKFNDLLSALSAKADDPDFWVAAS